jgi:ferric-chelate reductase (NADPH)
MEWVPGDKLRVRADALSLRTYTPISWGSERGVVRVLAYLHGRGPGSDWCRAVQVGDECRLLGPDGDAHLATLGDGALRALRAHPGAPVCLTGRARTIAVLRRLLKTDESRRSAIVKAYWDVSRKGLD